MSTDAELNQNSAAGAPTATKPIAEVLASGGGASPPLPVDESAAALELRLQKETDGRQKDKFYSFAIGTILLDMAVFQHIPWIGIICIFLLEILVLLGFLFPLRTAPK